MGGWARRFGERRDAINDRRNYLFLVRSVIYCLGVSMMVVLMIIIAARGRVE